MKDIQWEEENQESDRPQERLVYKHAASPSTASFDFLLNS